MIKQRNGAARIAMAIAGAAVLALGVGCASRPAETLEWNTSPHRLDPLLPNGIQMNGTAVVENGGGTFAYVIGGNRSTNHGGESTLIHYAPVEGSSIGPWAVADARLVGGGTSYHTRSTVGINGRIYVVGGRLNMEGDFSTPYNGVRVFTPDESGNIAPDSVWYYPADGVDGAGVVHPPLDLLEMSAVAVPSRMHPGDHIVHVMGGGLGDDATRAVRSFRVSGETGEIVGAGAGGPLRPALRLQAQLPETVAFAQAVHHGDHVYLVGNNPPSSTVYRAEVRANDTLGGWEATKAPLPVALLDAAAASFNGHLYVMGGTTGTNADVQNAVHRAVIHRRTGDITGWVADAPLPVTPGVRRIGATPSAGAIFLIGGRTADQGFLPEVQVGAPVAAE